MPADTHSECTPRESQWLDWLIERAHLEQTDRVWIDQLRREASRLARQKLALDEHAIVAITDAAGCITYANRKFCEISQYSQGELLGQTHRVVNSGYHTPSFFGEMWRTIRSGSVWRGEIRNRAKDGSHYWVATSIVPVKDEAGIIIEYVAIRNEITRRVEAEHATQRSADEMARRNAKLKRAQAEAEQARAAAESSALELAKCNAELESRNFELDEFSYMASHDLQEPLRKIIAFGKLLEADASTDLPETARRDLHFMTDAAARMQGLVQDLLKLSLAGRASLERKPTRLVDCAKVAIENLALKIAETGAQVTYDHLPEVEADATMVTQLYQNLLSNALKFTTAEKSALIHLSAERRDEQWVFGVRDNGIGIAPEHANSIFAPFKRLSGREQYEGSGIGLAICRKTVERHGGRIWVESPPGEGCHFRFTLAGGVKTSMGEVAVDNAQPCCGRRTTRLTF